MPRNKKKLFSYVPTCYVGPPSHLISVWNGSSTRNGVYWPMPPTPVGAGATITDALHRRHTHVVKLRPYPIVLEVAWSDDIIYLFPQVHLRYIRDSIVLFVCKYKDKSVKNNREIGILFILYQKNTIIAFPFI